MDLAWNNFSMLPVTLYIGLPHNWFVALGPPLHSAHHQIPCHSTPHQVTNCAVSTPQRPDLDFDHFCSSSKKRSKSLQAPLCSALHGRFEDISHCLESSCSTPESGPERAPLGYSLIV